MAKAISCPICRGSGKLSTGPCPRCKGQGQMPVSRLSRALPFLLIASPFIAILAFILTWIVAVAMSSLFG